MTENQGDLLGSAAAILSTILLLIAVQRAAAGRTRAQVRWLVIVSVALSAAGVAIVILT